jgi:predicted kinase
MILILIRGISGSGKTTHAKELIKQIPTFSHYEADMYFYRNGKYQFAPNKLNLAHHWCKTQTENDLQNGKSVIVSNTFTQKWELEPYIQLARKYNADILIKKATGNYQNVHGVPDDVVEKMRARWEDVEYEVSI